MPEAGACRASGALGAGAVPAGGPKWNPDSADRGGAPGRFQQERGQRRRHADVRFEGGRYVRDPFGTRSSPATGSTSAARFWSTATPSPTSRRLSRGSCQQLSGSLPTGVWITGEGTTTLTRGFTFGDINTQSGWGSQNPFYSRPEFVGRKNRDRNPYVSIGDTWVLSPALVMDVRLGVNRVNTSNLAGFSPSGLYDPMRIPRRCRPSPSRSADPRTSPTASTTGARCRASPFSGKWRTRRTGYSCPTSPRRWAAGR